MSAPARKVASRTQTARRAKSRSAASPPSRRPSHRSVRVAAPGTSPATRSTRRSPAPKVQAVQKSTVVFVVVTSAVAVAMVLGLVALNALLAQASFKIDDLQGRVGRLTQAYEERRLALARLSSPSHLAVEARRIGLQLPQDGIQVLHVPGTHRDRTLSKAVVGVRP